MSDVELKLQEELDQFKQDQIQQYYDNFDQNVILDVCHPNLDVNKRKTKDDDESEDNMVVIVEYRGKRYRVDFAREGEDLMKLPRQVKKQVALEDIMTTVGKEEKQREEEEREAEELKKRNPAYVNQIKQDERRSGLVERLRAKLLKKNPLRKDVKGTIVV